MTYPQEIDSHAAKHPETLPVKGDNSSFVPAAGTASFPLPAARAESYASSFILSRGIGYGDMEST
jgi:hypothetical protein